MDPIKPNLSKPTATQAFTLSLSKRTAGAIGLGVAVNTGLSIYAFWPTKNELDAKLKGTSASNAQLIEALKAERKETNDAKLKGYLVGLTHLTTVLTLILAAKYFVLNPIKWAWKKAFRTKTEGK